MWANVVRLTHAVVAQAAVGGTRGPEHLAGEAILEFHHLLVDDDLLGARRRPVAGAAGAVCTPGQRQGENRESFQDHIEINFLFLLLIQLQHR